MAMSWAKLGRSFAPKLSLGGLEVIVGVSLLMMCDGSIRLSFVWRLLHFFALYSLL